MRFTAAWRSCSTVASHSPSYKRRGRRGRCIYALFLPCPHLFLAPRAPALSSQVSTFHANRNTPNHPNITGDRQQWKLADVGKAPTLAPKVAFVTKGKWKLCTMKKVKKKKTTTLGREQPNVMFCISTFITVDSSQSNTMYQTTHDAMHAIKWNANMVYSLYYLRQSLPSHINKTCNFVKSSCIFFPKSNKKFTKMKELRKFEKSHEFGTSSQI